jgi:raffinose/stachyose/melibiose transport system substrate-binding protein/xylobiose transport system substrate-binding protein
MRRPARLRRIAGAAALATTLLAAAACGTSGPGGGGSGGSGGEINLWTLQSDTANPVLQARIDEFNKTATTKVKMTTYVNDAYKQKLQVSMGSPNAPDIFFNWGGGNLGQFVKANQVVSLDDALSKNAAVKDSFLTSVLDVGKVDGKQYGLPMSGMQPVILYYNKDVFGAAGVQPPKSLDELYTLIETFKAKKIAPIALAGSQGWTELMYLMYGLDRIGGQQKFTDIAAGKPGAWRDPAVLKALQTCQDLAKRGAFGSNFASINYDNTGASKLFATGKAAMHVMGSWEYVNQLSNTPKFIADKKMGWLPFPSITGGAGDPSSVVGVPANYFSVNSAGKHTDVAVDFLLKTLNADAYVDGLIKTGEVMPVKGIESKLAGTAQAEFVTFVYQTVANAKSFTLAWDQALSPSVGNEVNANLQKLFQSQITPEQFIATLEKAK